MTTVGTLLGRNFIADDDFSGEELRRVLDRAAVL